MHLKKLLRKYQDLSRLRINAALGLYAFNGLYHVTLTFRSGVHFECGGVSMHALQRRSPCTDVGPELASRKALLEHFINLFERPTLHLG